MNYYKDPYQPTSEMECHKGFEHSNVNRGKIYREASRNGQIIHPSQRFKPIYEPKLGPI